MAKYFYEKTVLIQCFHNSIFPDRPDRPFIDLIPTKYKTKNYLLKMDIHSFWMMIKEWVPLLDFEKTEYGYP